MIRKSATSGKMLFIIRHGKALAEGKTDFERPLSSRASLDLAKTCKHLASWGAPDFVLCSPSLRTVQTYQTLCKLLLFSCPELACPTSLYHASVDTLLNQIKQLPSQVKLLWIIGHNPGLTNLCNAFLYPSKINHLPTSGIAGFESSQTNWNALNFKTFSWIYWNHPKLYTHA